MIELSPVTQHEPASERELVSSQSVGDIRDSVGVAIGPGASVTIQQATSDAEQARQQENREQEKLSEAVSRLQANQRILAASPPPTYGSPYKNLQPYDLPDTAYFFGRNLELKTLCEALTCPDNRCQMTVLHGEAGIGKTSLIRAGLVPRLITAGHLPLLVRVSRKPLVDSIKQSLLPNLNETPALQQAPLREFLRRVCDLLPHGNRVCVLLDQFETFFDQPDEMCMQFIEQLAECLFDEDTRDNWLIAIQSSRLSRLSNFQPLIPQPLASLLEVPPLSCKQALRAMLQPARLGGYTFEDGLPNALLNDLGGKVIDPSALQMVCHTLVEGLPRGENRLLLADYERAGLAQGILRRYLDITLERHLTTQDRETAWRLLSVLIQVRSGAASPVELSARMQAYEVSSQETQRVLDLLESNRLVRWSGERYHLTHPSFRTRIQTWADQRAALEQARLEAIRQMERVRGSALRGVLGGSLGMVFAYLLIYSPQVYTDLSLSQNGPSPIGTLIFLSVLQILPGTFAGLLLTLMADIAEVSYHGPRGWLRWPVVGSSGVASYSGALVLFAYLNNSPISLQVLPIATEGALWGLAAGLGTVWAISAKRPAWQTLPAVALVCGLILWLADEFMHAFENPPYSWLVALAGGVMPLLILASTWVGRRSRFDLT